MRSIYENSEYHTGLENAGLAPSDTPPLEGTVGVQNGHGEEEDYTHSEMAYYHLSEGVKEFFGYATEDDSPDLAQLLNEIERTGLFILGLSQQKTMLGLLTMIGLYVRDVTNKTLVGSIMDFVKEEIGVTSQSSTTDKDEVPSWLQFLTGKRDDWMKCRTAPFFQQMSKLLGLLVTLKLCALTDVEFTVGDFKIFSPELHLRHKSALDIFDAGFETVTFFVERLYHCFKDRSLVPLFRCEGDFGTLDEDYATLQSWWNLVKCGNFTRHTGEPEHSFVRKLDSTIGKIRKMQVTTKDPRFQSVLTRYLTDLLTIQCDFDLEKQSSGVRHAPFAIQLVGESCQGKTTCGEQLVSAILASQGWEDGHEAKAVINPSERYWSTWRTDKLVAVLDDVANEKSNFSEVPPTRTIIDLCNNATFAAPMAELSQKGRVYVEPWIALLTTNVDDLNAGQYSNCPYSVQRRFIRITVKAKREYQRIVDDIACGLDPAKVFEKFGDEPRPFDDIWDLTVERAVMPKKISSVAHYSVVEWRGHELRDVPMRTVVNWAIEEFSKHRRFQEYIVAKAKDTTNIPTCDIAGCNQLKGHCMQHKDCCGIDGCGQRKGNCDIHVDGQSGLCFPETRKSIVSLISPICSKVDTSLATLATACMMKVFCHCNWLHFIPNMFVRSTIFRKIWATHNKYSIFLMMCALSVGNWLLVLINFALFGSFSLVFVHAIFSIWTQSQLLEVAEMLLHYLIQQRKFGLKGVFRFTQKEDRKNLLNTFVVLGLLYAAARMYKVYCALPQGSLRPKTEEEIAERDAEANPWFRPRVHKCDLPISNESKCTTCRDLSGVIAKNLLHMQAFKANGDKASVSNVLFVKSHFLLLPNHYFQDLGDRWRAHFIRNDRGGGDFEAYIDKRASYLIPNSDLRVCYVPAGGCYHNILKHFMVGRPKETVPFHMMWRRHTGVIREFNGMSVPGQYSNSRAVYSGGWCTNLSETTFPGLCGAVAITQTVGSAILGLHVGGINKKTIATHNHVTQEEIQLGMDFLSSQVGILDIGSDGTFPKEAYGQSLKIGGEPHKKNPLRYIPDETQVRYHGECGGRGTQKTDFKVTPISEFVMEECDLPNKFQPPVFNPDWWGFQKCVSNMSDTPQMYPFGLLNKACVDYAEPLCELIQDDLWKGKIKPLTDVQNVNGIPGCRFIDAIKSDTAAGYPLQGKKEAYMREVEVPDNLKDAGYQVLKEFDSVIMDEIIGVEEKYKRGERGYCIAKACKKDEAHTKDKCRIFYANSTAFTFLIRKYFLPLVRFIQMNPLLAECAVGVNCAGPEWEELYSYAVKHGNDNLLGGDYSKYDQRLSSQILSAALDILIILAEKAGYDEIDLKIMRTLSADLVYAYVNFDGSLISFLACVHISGNSLTVIINGICGALNQRCAYFNKAGCSKEVPPFRDKVSLVTYGDDNFGSTCLKWFTIKYISQFLGEYGQIYTMPDKGSELKDFLPPDAAEFLKRKNVYHPALKASVGALSEESISKPLHCFFRGKKNDLTEEQACAQNISTALNEWFLHGEKVYEDRRDQMKTVAAKANLTHMVQGLEESYHDRCEQWKHLYKRPRAAPDPYKTSGAVWDQLTE